MTILNRRDMLLTSTAATLAIATGTRNTNAVERAAAVPLKLGLVTYNWGRDWDLPTVISNCEKTGFTGVELRSTHKHGVEITLSSDERKAVRQQFADSSVELVGLGSACEYHSPDPDVVKKNIEETRQFLQLSHDLGASGVKVRPNGLPKEVPLEKTIEQIGRALNETGRIAADLGQQIRVEVHGRGTAELPVMDAIMEVADHPSVGICWNCNAGDLDGEGLEHNFNLVRDRMATVHIHDLTKDDYPWPELFELLKTVDAESFTGWALLEDGRVPDDIVAAMHANLPAFENLAE